MASSCRQVCRHFSTSSRLLKGPNIQKPRVPGTERRILDAVTVPILPPDLRPLPQRCHDNAEKRKRARTSELNVLYRKFRLNQAMKLFHENRMVAICHILPMTSRESSNVRTQIITSGMQLSFARNDLAREAIANTRLQNLMPYITADNVYITSNEYMVPELVTVLRKTPSLQLLGGLVDDRILSREAFMNAAKMPPLDTMRGELLTILSASASKTSHFLSRHQQELSANLEQLVKQGGENQEGGVKEENRDESSSKEEEPQT